MSRTGWLPAGWIAASLLASAISEWKGGAAENAGLRETGEPAWQRGEGFSFRDLHPQGKPGGGLTRLKSSDTGLSFTNRLGEILSANNQVLENGSGVALGDVDGDGWCDIYLCGLENSNRLFRNLGGWKFADATATAGVGCDGQFSTGAVLVDVDGDADLDLLVNGLGTGTRLFRNDGQGRFTEEQKSGLLRTSAATSLALSDVDRDGDLDLYVANYRSQSARNDPRPPAITARQVNGRLVITPADRFTGFLRPDGKVELVEKGEPDAFYLNDGAGFFKAVSWTNGVFLDERGQALNEAPTDWGLSVLVRDLTGDGWPDIYVCNDFLHSRDRFWIGQGDGHFRAAPARVWRGMPLSSMAIDAGDLNRDGAWDFLVVEMLSRDHRARQRQRANVLQPSLGFPWSDPEYQPEWPRNTLQMGQGNGTFVETAWMAGLAMTDWSWGVAFLDVDLDGWEDILITTGNQHDVQDMDAAMAPPKRGVPVLARYPPLRQAKLAFRNRGDMTFVEEGVRWGFADVGISQGMALGDLDNDGDLDVVVNNLNDAAGAYRNDAAAARIGVRLAGATPNTAAIGAAIRVIGNGLPQSQVLQVGGRYMSGDDAQRTFAAGGADKLTIEVTWPKGAVTRWEGLPVNRVYRFEEATATHVAGPQLGESRPAALFEDVSAQVNHTHVDAPFDDWARQPLLPWRLSELGPGLVFNDLDGDGYDDLLIGGGTSGSAAFFRNSGKSGFEQVTNAAGPARLAQDMTGALGLRLSATNRAARWIEAFSTYESPNSSGRGLVVRAVGTKEADQELPLAGGAAGPIASADIDGDGDLDLCVGGRVWPGRYPVPPTSWIFLNEGEGQFGPDTSQAALLGGLGMVSGAVFSDVDGDGDPDLALACEWGPVRVLRNEHGKFSDATEAFGLANFTGFWSAIATGDFNNDGAPDLVVANIGRNQHREGRLPWFTYCFEGASEGALGPIEAFTDPATGRVVSWRARDVLEKVIPQAMAAYPTHRAFAETSLAEVLGARFTQAKRLTVQTLETAVLLNRGASFERKVLPWEAQIAPVQGIVVADFNNDGSEDLFLAQNRFSNELESGRGDAGRGLVLLGDGQGSFRPLRANESGIEILGEQRAAAVADYDGDGRIDLVVALHRGATRLFHNTESAAGVRITLRGAGENPDAIGASLRLHAPTGFGPLREIQAGSGYWSQNSTALVFPKVPGAQLWVRWPNGRTNEYPLGNSIQIQVSQADGPAPVP